MIMDQTHEQLFKRYLIGLKDQLDPVAQDVLREALSRLWDDVSTDGKLDDDKIRDVLAVGDECSLYKSRLRAMQQAFGTGKGYSKF